MCTKYLGPGCCNQRTESVFYELIACGLRALQQKELPTHYRSVVLDAGYRIDLLVEDLAIVVLKAVDSLLPIHDAQFLPYLKLPGMAAGLLVNFNAVLLKDGIKRLSRSKRSSQ